MKKLYSILAMALMAGAGSAHAVSVPYYSTIGNKSATAIASDWTLVDHNSDDKTWMYDGDDNNLTATTGANCGVKYQYHKTNAADDWLISPPLELTAGIEYQISYWLKETSANKEAFKVFVGTEASVDALAATTPIAEYSKNIGTTWRNEKKAFTPETSGTYYVAFQVCSEKDQYNLLLRGFNIKANITLPAAPAALVAEAAAGQALSAHLAWELPTLTDEGAPLPAALEAVKVYRGDVEIATLPGDATEYTDEVPESGVYTYAVAAVLNGYAGRKVEATTGWIGPKTPQALPFTEIFDDKNFYPLFWTTIDVDGDAKANASSSYPPLSNAWCFQTNLMGNATWAAIYTSRNAQVQEDDWLISPPLAFPGPGKYKVSFKAAMYSGGVQGCRVNIYAGQAPTPEDMTIQVGEMTSAGSTALNPNDAMVPLHEYEFETEAGGTFYVGFHSTNTPTDVERRLQLSAISIELIEQYEAPIRVYDTPFDSQTFEGWQPATLLNFALDRGYYNVTFESEGEVELNGEVEPDMEFSEDYLVLKAAEPAQVTFASTENFTAFAILPADHTPAAAAECRYEYLDLGQIVKFHFVCPSLNVAGEPLYEITKAEIYQDGILIEEVTGLNPGDTKSVEHVIAAEPEAPDSRAASSHTFELVTHSLSGASEAVAFQGITGVETIGVDAAGAAELFTPQGVRVHGSATPGLYIRRTSRGAEKVIIR